MLEEIYRGFSCPACPLDSEALDAIVTAHMARVVGGFLTRYAAALAPSGGGLADYLAGWGEHEATLGGVWNTAFGVAERLPWLESSGDVAAGDVARLAAAYGARLGLAMQAAGHAGTFRAVLGAPVRLRFDRFFLPAADRIAAVGDGTSLVIDLGATGRVAFARGGGRWLQVPGDGLAADELVQVPIADATATFVSDEVLGNERQEGIPYPLAAATAEVAAAWEAVFALVRRCSPSYLHWIDRGLRDIVPLAVPDGAMISGSHTERWGEIYFTAQLPPLKLAEMLVHECSHQHYFFAGFLGAVEDGSDTHLYYSPVKKTGRPIEKILLAYHAFANVILFYRECREQGIATGVEEGTILPELAQLEEPLRQTRGLTDLGRAIWEPLADMIARPGGQASAARNA